MAWRMAGNELPEMKGGPIFPTDTLRFFRELGQNNHKPWMDENRGRYKESVVEPFRDLLDRLTPFVRKLNPAFTTSGRTGENFSRINRDIRFAADKTPYRTQMYLYFSEASADGQLYVGLSPEATTAGFRAYAEGRESSLAVVARERGQAHGRWLERQRKRLGKKYESYWYSTEKGEWAKHAGWPLEAGDWKKLQAWVVRRKFPASAPTRAGFEGDVQTVFRDVYPLYVFCSAAQWKP